MSGDLQRDKAFNKMAKLMEKSNGKHERPETLMQQIKRIYGDRWKQELEEIFIEESHATYKADKLKAIAVAKQKYEMNVPRWDRTDELCVKFMHRELDNWRDSYKRINHIKLAPIEDEVED